ncbi:MAG: deoxyribodipyrimidine photo-lyase, partial [Candidatus Cryosericum sp.]
MVNPERLHELNGLSQKASGPILYWMQRDMRAQDNWALLYAQQQARALHLPLMVCFALAPSFAGATLRAYDALLRGLQEVEDDLRRLNIPFLLLTGNPPEQVGRLLSKLRPALMVTDFNPLPAVVVWKEAVAATANCRVVEVDAHNIVPAWVASNHQEWSAATLRRKL